VRELFFHLGRYYAELKIFNTRDSDINEQLKKIRGEKNGK